MIKIKHNNRVVIKEQSDTIIVIVNQQWLSLDKKQLQLLSDTIKEWYNKSKREKRVNRGRVTESKEKWG